MATSTQKVTAGELISATVKYNNNDDANRAFNIEAEVSINNGTVTNFNSGVVRRKNEENGANVATFGSWSDNQLNVDFQNLSTREESLQILTAIYDFRTDVKNTVAAGSAPASI